MFVDSFQKMGFVVKYVESNYQGRDQNIISVRQDDNITGYLYGNIKRFYICLIQNYDLLFLQNFTPLTLPCLIAAKLRMKPIVVDWDAFEFIFQKTVFRKIITYIIEFVFPYFVDYIISPSSYLINCVRKRGIQNISKVPHFIDTNLFDPNKFLKHDLKERMSWNNKIIICYLCAFNPGGIRDLEIILKAAKIVMNKVHNAHLLLIGEGELKNKVLELIKQYDINNYYILGIKSQDKVAEYLNVADICLIYLRDDLGNIMRTSIKLFTYLSMNRTVVGYLVGESKDLFGDYIISCKPDVNSFADNILEIIKKKHFATYARNYIIENYNYRIIPKYLNEVFTKINIK